MSTKLNFIRQQGFKDASAQSCDLQFQSLMWQPRLIALLVLLGLLVETGWYFLGLSAVLFWSALLPKLSPFDAIYNRFIARPRGSPELTPALSPRRFSQTAGGTFALAIGLSMRAGHSQHAWTLWWIFMAFILALVVGRLCFGAFIYYSITGKVAYALRTMPWSRSE